MAVATIIFAAFLMYLLLGSEGIIWYNLVITLIMGVINVLFAVYAYRISSIIKTETNTAPRNALLYAHFLNMSIFTVGSGVMVYLLIMWQEMKEHQDTCDDKVAFQRYL